MLLPTMYMCSLPIHSGYWVLVQWSSAPLIWDIPCWALNHTWVLLDVTLLTNPLHLTLTLT